MTRRGYLPPGTRLKPIMRCRRCGGLTLAEMAGRHFTHDGKGGDVRWCEPADDAEETLS